MGREEDPVVGRLAKEGPGDSEERKDPGKEGEVQGWAFARAGFNLTDPGLRGASLDGKWIGIEEYLEE